METISIEDERNGKVYEYKKPEFEHGLLKVIENNKHIKIIGYIIVSGNARPCMWTEEGKCFVGEYSNMHFNLKKVKPKWHDDKSKFPALIVRGKCPTQPAFPNEVSIAWNKEYFINHLEPAGWKLASEDEVQIFHYGNEDG